MFWQQFLHGLPSIHLEQQDEWQKRIKKKRQHHKINPDPMILIGIQQNQAMMTQSTKKKKAPHWMDCNCQCHGFMAEDEAPACPHCKPKLFPDYEI